MEEVKEEVTERFEREPVDRLGVAQLQKIVHAWSKGKGWWDGFDFTALPRALTLGNGRNGASVQLDQATTNYIASKLLMIGTEVSEAAEALRVGDMIGDPVKFSHDRKPDGLKSELADIIIRVVDLAEALGMDMDQALKDKMAYNATRSYRHGNKAL